ncbi:Lrp/AsnC family transcriptional regulator [Leucobacter luti]|uniref:Lrp/AsnC family transcriptional regulator n=1 Tax=Leucobacter luti TaxID=340320 RepID=UPI0013006F54|nr:Lrp/AsnC ligand binding domain-containing protein [Leucobacter luti]
MARRIDWLLGSGQLSIRAIVDPADVGFSVEAVLWVQAAPQHVEALGQHLTRWPEVRYAAAIAGTSQLLVNIVTPSHAALYLLLARPVWAKYSQHVRTDLIHSARASGAVACAPPTRSSCSS